VPMCSRPRSLSEAPSRCASGALSHDGNRLSWWCKLDGLYPPAPAPQQRMFGRDSSAGAHHWGQLRDATRARRQMPSCRPISTTLDDLLGQFSMQHAMLGWLMGRLRRTSSRPCHTGGRLL
jgi:hypothetical protein